MTPEERERLLYLCSRLQEEEDPITFDGLVRELNDLLEIKHKRLDPSYTNREPS